MRITLFSSPNNACAQRLAQLRLAHARRSQEDKRTDRAIRILQSRTGAANGARNAPDRLLLPDHASDAASPRDVPAVPLRPRSSWKRERPSTRPRSAATCSSPTDSTRLAHALDPIRSLRLRDFALQRLFIVAQAARRARNPRSRRRCRSARPISSSRTRCSFMSGGAVYALIRTRDAASSIRSIALSGRQRSGI